ncbi:MAG TPA: hypothetical protein VJZ76_21290 [Thermoanaerobaculia bacterium]|nr:hypothetical protein [Thermoanaerobaculia bacterium]
MIRDGRNTPWCLWQDRKMMRASKKWTIASAAMIHSTGNSKLAMQRGDARKAALINVHTER